MNTDDGIDKKQKLLIEYLASNRTIFLKIYSILKPRYFDQPLNRVVDFLVEYFNKYNNIPNFDILTTETEIDLKERKIEAEEIDYVVDELEEYCQQSAMRHAILDSVDDIETGNFTAIDARVREAMMVKVHTDIGLNIFENPALRLQKMQEDIDSRSTGYKQLDDLLDNIKRSELGIFSAGTGGGKSVQLANMARNMASDGLNTLVVSLELDQPLYAKRFDTIISGIPVKEIFDRVEEVDDFLNNIKDQYGSIIVKKEKPGLSPAQLRVMLMEYHLVNGFYPDVLVIDYVDLMGTDDKRLTGKFDIDEEKTHGLRDLVSEFGMYGFTACQLNRDSVGTVDLNYSHVAGGLSKVNACDWMVAIYQTEEDIDNDVVNFKQLKIRNAEKNPQPFQMYRCPKTLRVYENIPKTTNLSSPLTQQNNNPSKQHGNVKQKGQQKLKDALNQ